MNQSLNIPKGKFAGEDAEEMLEYQIKERNGFVTFWLWFAIVGCVINGFMTYLSTSSLGNLGLAGMDLIVNGTDVKTIAASLSNYTLMLTIAGIVASLLMIWGYVKLLNWHKSGFWMILATALIIAPMNYILVQKIIGIYNGLGFYLTGITPWQQAVVSIVSIAILWGILQLRKDGVSCWSQLD